MKEVTLFEIPIYSMEEKEFNRRWNKEIKKYINTNEQYNQIWNTFFPKNLWKYNQIVGYIVINLIKYDYGIDINFEWYQSDKKLYRFNSNEKNFVQKESLIGYHFFIDENDSNNEIIKKLLKLSIRKNILVNYEEEAKFVRPEYKVLISYLEKTKDGKLRQPVFRN